MGYIELTLIALLIMIAALYLVEGRLKKIEKLLKDRETTYWGKKHPEEI